MRNKKIKFTEEELKEAKCQFRKMNGTRPYDNFSLLDALMIIGFYMVEIVYMGFAISFGYNLFLSICIMCIVYFIYVKVSYELIFIQYDINCKKHYLLYLEDENLDCTGNTVTYKGKDITKEMGRYKSPYEQVAFINRLKNRI